jgi:hypothetical protein
MLQYNIMEIQNYDYYYYYYLTFLVSAALFSIRLLP